MTSLLEGGLPKEAAAPEQEARRSPGAVVAGASHRSLAVVRSLGRRGIPVCVLRSGGHSLAGWSRYAQRSFAWPGGDDRERRDELLGIADEHGLDGWTLIATDDEDAGLMARQHAALSEIFAVAVPPWRTLKQACDKQAVHRLADRIGLPHPRTAFPADAREAAVLDVFRGVDQVSFVALCSEGRVLASLTARLTRQHPLDGASAFVQTVADEAVARSGRRLLEAMRFTGMAEVEFKRHPVTGVNMLLDVDPSAWGWLSLGERAGIDFPFLLWQDMAGMASPEAQARPGVRRVGTSHRLPAHVPFAADDPLPALVDTGVLGAILLSRFLHRRAS